MYKITTASLSWEEVLTILFVVFSPLKVVGPFAAITRDMEPTFCRRLAWRTTLFAAVEVVVATVLGQRILLSWGIRYAVLLLAGGIVWFLIALMMVLQPYLPMLRSQPTFERPSLALAFRPLSFPTIVTPYGVATLIIMVATMPTLGLQILVLALTGVMLLLNWVAMIFARPILHLLALPLELVGWVLGVLQVALALNLIYIAILSLSATAARR